MRYRKKFFTSASALLLLFLATTACTAARGALASLDTFALDGRTILITAGATHRQTLQLNGGPYTLTLNCTPADTTGDLYEYEWAEYTEPNAEILQISNYTSKTVTITPQKIGTTLVKVIVADNNNGDVAELPIEVVEPTGGGTPNGITFYEGLGTFGEPFVVFIGETKLFRVDYTYPDSSRGASDTPFSALAFTPDLPEELELVDIVVKDEAVYLYVKGVKTGAVDFSFTLQNGMDWDPATCRVHVVSTSGADTAGSLIASPTFTDANEATIANDTASVARVLQGPGIFGVITQTINAARGAGGLDSVISRLGDGRDPKMGYPLNWFAVTSATFAAIDTSDSPGLVGSVARIEAPVAESDLDAGYMPMQSVFIVPRGAFGNDEFDEAVQNPRSLLERWYTILLQPVEGLYQSRSVDLFGGSVAGLTLDSALADGTVEFFYDEGNQEMLAALNYILVDAPAPDGTETPVAYEDGILRIYDGQTNGVYTHRAWLAERASTGPSPEDGATGGGGGCSSGFGLSALLAIALSRRRT